MRKIKNGDLTAQPDYLYRSLEFKQVNETFNSMIQEITKLKINSYEKQLLAERAELDALKMQIRPHFFLNCLKSLYALAEARRTADIQKTILGLSNHLRYVFYHVKYIAALKRNCELCQNYINLQDFNKATPTQLHLDVDACLMKLPIPPVSLLTFVENSLKHGVQENQPLLISISARQLMVEDGNLVNITFGDNGPGFPVEKLAEFNQINDDTQSLTHVGLINTIRRFKIIHGDEFAYAFTNRNGAQIELFIPVRVNGQEDINETTDCG